jgi:hypothetical protein
MRKLLAFAVLAAMLAAGSAIGTAVLTQPAMACNGGSGC